MSENQAVSGTFGPIQTSRLRLRRYVESEVNLVHRVMSDSRVMRYYPAVYDLERSRMVLTRILESYQTPGYSLLAVERTSDGEFLGQVGLLHWDDVDAREDVEVAYLLLPDYWGMGYATESARACRDWAFVNLRPDRVVSFIAVENRPSIAVAERNGMTRLKRLESNRFGTPIYVYGISAKRWAPDAGARKPAARHGAGP
jgi:[ribosomal protein S5]-alanine N-acetyltransferase